jgi:membrane protein YqaA with SNARE-associated domain
VIPRLLAALWGFAEATLFFIVPDVLLSWLALRDRRTALVACGFALGGALAGGLLMYAWGAAGPAAAVQAVEQVPAIGADMLARVRGELAQQGAWATLFGPISGTPYKTYAIQAHGAGVSVWAFALVSVPARGLRFVLVALLAEFVARRAFPRLGLHARRMVLAAVWIAFYAFYFTVMPG